MIITNIEDIMKVKPLIKIRFRVLITNESVSIDEEGNAYYERKQNWVYNKNAHKVVKYKIKVSSGRPDERNNA